MSTVGIIAEYNPFHNGHAYQIKKAKELSGADNVVIVISGNYVQRGAPAIIDKYSRAKHAITNGADLVIELPVCYSTASAELFAHSAVTLLNQLGCIDYLSFGCENNNLSSLKQIAGILAKEPDEYKSELKSLLSTGLSYPQARYKAIEKILNNDDVAQILNTPNNILAIEYLKSIIISNSNIKPVPVKRIDNGYHSTTTDGGFASATAIRNCMHLGDINSFENLVPGNTLQGHISSSNYIFPDDFSDMLAYGLIYRDNYEEIFDINTFLSNRINNTKKEYINFSSYSDLLLTKNETHTHINRALIHLMLGITKNDIDTFKEYGYILYAKPLAINTSNTSILKSIKNNSSIPLITRFGDYYKKQGDVTKQMLDMNLKADELYNQIFFNKHGIRLTNDFNTHH